MLGFLFGGVVIGPIAALGARSVAQVPSAGAGRDGGRGLAAPDHGAAPGEAGLLGSIAVGAKLADGVVTAVEPPAHGAIRVRVGGARGEEYCLEVLARDGSEGAPRPPAETERYSVFVSNGGLGSSATAEEHARAALALAAVIAEREHDAADPGLLTHRARLEAHRGAMLEHIDGSAPALV